VVLAGGFEGEIASAWPTSSFCKNCCFCIFFLSLCDIFWIPFACSELPAFIASVRFDGRETEASAMMSLRPVLLDVDLTALQGGFWEADPDAKVRVCGVRDAAGEEEYCGRWSKLPGLEASMLTLPAVCFALASGQLSLSRFGLPTSKALSRSRACRSGEVGSKPSPGENL
jgi:hypothetical protein